MPPCALVCALLVTAAVATPTNSPTSDLFSTEQDINHHTSRPEPQVPDGNTSEENAGNRTEEFNYSLEGDIDDSLLGSSAVSTLAPDLSFTYPPIVYKVLADTIHCLCVDLGACKKNKDLDLLSVNDIGFMEGLNISQYSDLMNVLNIDSNLITFSSADPVSEGRRVVKTLSAYLHRLEQPGVMEQFVRAGTHTFTTLMAMLRIYGEAIGRAMTKVDMENLEKQFDKLMENIFDDIEMAYTEDVKKVISKFMHVMEKTVARADLGNLWEQLKLQIDPVFEYLPDDA